jgi:DNA-binding response OmpR family regulator
VRGRALPLTVLGTTGSQYLVCGMQGFQAHSASGEIHTTAHEKSHPAVVDDDLGILEFYETMLGNNGYDVLLAKDGPHALAVFRERVKEIDAVISDYEMPGINGIELAAELKRHSATLPVIMISGGVPLLEGTRHPVDALFSKGVPVEEILARIEFLPCMKRADECAVF